MRDNCHFPFQYRDTEEACTKKAHKKYPLCIPYKINTFHSSGIIFNLILLTWHVHGSLSRCFVEVERDMDEEKTYSCGVSFVCLFVWIMFMSLFSTCRPYRDRQKPANGTPCPTLTTAGRLSHALSHRHENTGHGFCDTTQWYWLGLMVTHK